MIMGEEMGLLPGVPIFHGPSACARPAGAFPGNMPFGASPSRGSKGPFSYGGEDQRPCRPQAARRHVGHAERRPSAAARWETEDLRGICRAGCPPVCPEGALSLLEGAVASRIRSKVGRKRGMFLWGSGGQAFGEPAAGTVGRRSRSNLGRKERLSWWRTRTFRAESPGKIRAAASR